MIEKTRILLPSFALVVTLPLLAGCGSATAATPTLLMQQNVNGSYNIMPSDADNQPVLFSGSFASSKPLANSGENYYSEASAAITPGIANDEGGCNGQTIQLSGRVTNPNVNDVNIDLAGDTPGGGKATISGGVTRNGPNDLGSKIVGTMQISGGSCPMDSTQFVAIRQ